MNSKILSEISDLLNNNGFNYSVFLDSYTFEASSKNDAIVYIRKAFGETAEVENIKVVNELSVIREVLESLNYPGGSGEGPSMAILTSPTFTTAVDKVVEEIKVIARTAHKIEQFELNEGHPAYPVFWDFAFLFTCSDNVIIFIGSSSD